MKRIFIAWFSILALNSPAQTDSTKKSITVSGYVETYYAYDFANPSDHNRPGFVYSYNRHNEVNLNLGFAKAAYETSKARANLALMTGTYANANLAAEPGVFKNIFEANAGVRLSSSKKLWVDMGIFPSHIGFESAVGKDCWNLTRSLLADNSPYYESGAKISYTNENDKWFISALVLNGWQRIQRVNGNNTPAFGHQITYKPNSNTTFNSSSFIGSDTPDSTRLMRYFHNFYGQFQLLKKLGIILGFDIGWQQKNKSSSQYNTWYSPVLIARYTPNKKLSIAARGEYYSDEHGVIVSTSTPHNFQTYGYSVNVDYRFAENMIWRIESRALNSRDEIFSLDGQPDRNNYMLITSLAISL